MALSAVAALGLIAYLDVRARLSDLRVEVAELRGGAAPPVRPTPTSAPAEPDAGASPADFVAYNLGAPVDESEWECEGRIGEEMVAASIGRYGQSVFDCYAQRREVLAELAGSLVLYLRVGPDGAVGPVRAVGSISDHALRACAARAAQEWRFPPPEGGECAIVQAPFQLSP